MRNTFTENRIFIKTPVPVIVLLFLLFLARAEGQNINLTLSAHLSYGTETLSNIWGWVDTADSKEYALVGAENGMSVVDVSNPSSPVLMVQIPGPTSVWREIKTVGDYAYITTESGAAGLQIVELTNLPSTNLAVASWKPQFGPDTLKTIHALHADNGKVYLYGSNIGGKGAIVADVTTNPMAPVYLGSYDNGGYIHDGYVQGDTMYASHIYTGSVEIVNMASPAAGVPLAAFSTPNNFTHNTWLSSDSKTCFTTDERDSSFLTAFDVSDLANIEEQDRIQSNPGSGSIVHNTCIVNKGGIDYAVTSWYKDGITVVDASRPNNLVQVGNYDTCPLSGNGYGGCWGVYPYLPSGTVLVSDIDSGLYVLSPDYVRGCYLEGTVTDCSSGDPIPGAQVQIQNPGPGSGSATDLSDALGKYGAGVLLAGTYTVVVSKTGYLPQTFTVAVTSGNVTGLNVQLCVTGIKEVAYNNPEVSIFPNPFMETALLEITGTHSSATGAQFILNDVFGREVLHLPFAGNKLIIDRGALADGIYLYEIQENHAVIATGKLCVE